MYAAALALATSCTNELENLSIQEQGSRGLTFKAEIEEAGSRAELVKDEATGVWNMFWYAEDDKMDIFGKDIALNGTTINDWDYEDVLTYKASRTLGEGYFVSTDAKTYEFVKKNPTEWKTPSFRYTWPAGLTVVTDGDSKLNVTLPSINAQEQSDLNGSSTVQYAFMSGKLDNVTVPANPEKHSASDVLIGMTVTRKFPLALFSVKNYDESLHGKFVSITLKSLGQKDEEGNYDLTTREILDYGTDAHWDLVADKKIADGTDAKKLVKLTFDSNLKWEDNATAFMTFNTVDRSQNTKPSWMVVEYEFENITFTDIFSSTRSYEAHQAYRMSGTTANPSYDLQAEEYLVVENGASNYALVINPSFTGNVAKIFNAAGKVKDPFNSTITYDVTDFDRLVVYPDVADPTTFAKFTELKDVKLVNETELHKGMFNASIEKLSADKVVKVNYLFNTSNGITAKLSAYTDLSLASYLFKESSAINELFFNDTHTINTLLNLNISGVKDMIYPFQEISLVFENYNLETVVLNAEGVNVGQKAFKNCTSLEEVTGKVNLTTFDATEAFMNTGIDEINVIGTSIPASAFEGCSNLVEFVFDASLRNIGALAFKSCSALQYVDLANIRELGEQAFNNSGLKSANKNTNLLTVGANTIPFAALANTDVTVVRFTRATEIGNAILKNTDVKQVRFDRAFGYIDGTIVDATSFGNYSTTVMLYVNKSSQKNVNGSKLSVPASWVNGNIATWNTVEFKGIYDNAYWEL